MEALCDLGPNRPAIHAHAGNRTDGRALEAAQGGESLDERECARFAAKAKRPHTIASTDVDSTNERAI